MKQTFKIQILSLLFLFLAMHTKAQDCDALMEKAYQADSKKEAVAFVQQAITLGKKNNWNNLANAYYELATVGYLSFSDSLRISFLDTAIRINPKPEYYILKGETIWILDRTKRMSVKIGVINEGLQIYPNNISLLYEKGLFLVQAESYQGAKRLFLKVKELMESKDLRHEQSSKKVKIKFKFYLEIVHQSGSPSFRKYFQTTESNIESIFYEIGYCEYGITNYKEAILWYQKAIELAPKNVSFRTGLARAYDKLNNIDEMTKNFEYAIKLQNSYDDEDRQLEIYNIYEEYGELLLKHKQYEQAIVAFSIAEVKYDNIPDIYNEWGYAYFMTGDYQKAIEKWNIMETKESYDEYTPKHNYIEEARAKMKKTTSGTPSNIVLVLPPVVRFSEKLPPSVSKPILSIKGCIKGNDIIETAVFVNDKRFNSKTKDFIVTKQGDCDKQIVTNINLQEGKNSIYLTATNASGTKTSEIQTVIYNKMVAQTKSEVIISERRLALVIGNGKYPSAADLGANPINDADLMTKTLEEECGFTVLKYHNLKHEQIDSCIRDFIMKLKNHDVGLLFFSGHGLEAENMNYIMPIDAQPRAEANVKYSCVNVTALNNDMEATGAKLSILIIDACRNNPFKRSWQALYRSGNAVDSVNRFQPTAVDGNSTVIAYAASSGKTASNGETIGLYTSTLVNFLKTPNLRLFDVFNNTNAKVKEISNNEQRPRMDMGGFTGEFFFKKQ
jgi:tetratricopeptide (TPR) repeat protein